MRKTAGQFLIFTFCIMLLCWGTCLLCSRFGYYLSNMPLLYVPFLAGGFSPTIASWLVWKKQNPSGRFKEWLAIIFDFHHNLFSYLLLPGLAALFFFTLCRFSGYKSGAPFFAIIFMIPMMLFGGGLEEAGWRGILFPELESRFGYTPATIYIASIWWFWHLPLFFIPGVSQYGTDFIVFGINVFGLSFALSAIKKVTGSTWLCVLFHCAINSLHGVYLVGESRIGSLAAAAALIAASYVVVGIQKKKGIFT